MQHVVKNSHKIPKGVRLNWTSIKEVKSMTVEKMNIKGSKVFSGVPSGRMTQGNFDCNNFLIP